MKKSQLKKLIREVIEERFNSGVADEFDILLEPLTPEQKNDNAEIFKIIDGFCKNVKKNGASYDLSSYYEGIRESLKRNGIDPGLLDDYLNDEAGASDDDDPWDDRSRVDEISHEDRESEIAKEGYEIVHGMIAGPGQTEKYDRLEELFKELWTMHHPGTLIGHPERI